MMFFRWLASTTLRNAFRLRKHVRNLIAAQRDILAPQAVANLDRAMADFDTVLHSEPDDETLKVQMEKIEAAASKWIKPYPNAGWRENVEVILVAVSVAMAVRTFFIQPFKIPTGSMQPTLFGVMSDNLIGNSAFQVPTGLERIKEWFQGVSYIQVTAPDDGELGAVGRFPNGTPKATSEPAKFLIFNLWQTYEFAGREYKIWFPPDLGEAPIEIRTMDQSRALTLYPGRSYHKGEDIIKLRVSAGDHLFVDRVTYNFRKPERGEIAVFETGGINGGPSSPPPDEFYIKRLCVLPGEQVQIGNDRHLIINGHRLDKTTPHFEKVYGFDPSQGPRENQYSGHVNGVVNLQYPYLYYPLAPLFPNQETIYTNGPDSYMVFGDNTCNSSDSRAWGPFPSHNVIGKSWFVYWPLTSRFGWGNR